MSVQHWESYYRGGALVSAPLDVEPNYTKEVRDAWVAFFSDLDGSARILDVGTGNGPIPLIAKEVRDAGSTSFDIHGADLARIDPIANVEDGAELFDGITFHSETPCEELPFDDDNVDAVTGQYVIEYTDIERALSEIFRILKPEGRCQFIIHHDESVVVCNARESLAHADLAVHELKMLRKLRRFCVPDSDSPATIESARQAMIDVGQRLADELRRTSNPIFLDYLLRSSAQLFQLRLTATQGALLQYLKRLDDDVRNWTRRLQDLESGALTEGAMQSLAQTATTAGFTDVSFVPQYQDGDQLVGWLLVMNTPAAAN